MDLGVTIVGTIMISIIIVPFIIVHFKRVNKDNKRIQSLKDYALLHNCQISHYEICGNYTIGIDENKKSIFFQNQMKENVDSQHLELSYIRNCKVVIADRKISSNGHSNRIIDRIDLLLTPTDKDKVEVKLNFYNAEISMQLSGELQSVEKWGNRISDLLKIEVNNNSHLLVKNM
jgi:hypothetical protein